MFFPLTRQTVSLIAAMSMSAAIGVATPAGAADLPGDGITAKVVHTPVTEEQFQTYVVAKGLRALGYTVPEPLEASYSASELAIANGDIQFTTVFWDPLHTAFYEKSGGAAKLEKVGHLVPKSVQGYMIDKKTADKYHIKTIDQLKDPKIAKLFDTDGDGKADLTGCNPGWGCERVIEHQLDAYKLRKTVTHNQGSYFALMADTISNYKQGKPILFYTWTPLWVTSVLQPGKDVTWLTVPFTSLPGERKDVDTSLPDGRNLGFAINDQRILANRKWLEANPAAKKFFELCTIPVGDVSAENMLVHKGESSMDDINRHADDWIKAHQKEWDSWIAASLKAAQSS